MKVLNLFLVLNLLLVFSSTTFAEDLKIKGKVQTVSNKAKVIQLLNLKTKKVQVIKFDKNTKFIEASSIKDIAKNTKIIATIKKVGAAAYSIKRILVKVPKDQLITTLEVEKAIAKGGSVFIGDARPLIKCQQQNVLFRKN